MEVVVEILVLIARTLWTFVVAIVRWVLPKQYKSVKDEVVLITGAGSGIGRLMAVEFAKRGAVLVLWDVNEKGNEETAEMIKETGGKAFAQTCDVSKKDEVKKMAQKARVVAGDITILINNAGIVYGKGLLDTTDDEIEKTMQVNALAHFWTVRAFLPSMLEKNHGHIVTINSVMGFAVMSGMASYVASKHASLGFHDTLAMDLRNMKKDGIKTTLVCPYHVTTGLFKGITIRFPFLLPPLSPEKCVQTIMHAVLTDRPMVVIPRSMYTYYNAMTWLPREALLLVNDFFELDKVMSKFIPNRDYQKEAAGVS